MVEDDAVKVIALYLEGLKDTKKFIKALKSAAEKRKPIIVLKAGKSQKGAASAASHTGNLAGSSKSYESVFKKFGVLTVDCLEDLMCLAQMFSVLDGNIPEVSGVAGINLSGGENTICADLCEQHGISLPDISDKTKEETKKYLPDFATPKNPLDATTAIFGDKKSTIGLIKSFEKVDDIGSIIMGANIRENVNPVLITLCEALAESRQAGCTKPIFVIPPFEASRNLELRNILESGGVVLMSSTKSAFHCIKEFTKFVKYNYKLRTLNIAVPDKNTKRSKSYALTEYDSKQEMKNYGLPIPKQKIVNSIDDISSVVSEMEYPLVLKVNSPDILHKTDAGGVKLNINSKDEAIDAYEDILSNCKHYNSNAQIDGVLVQEMVPEGIEIIIGINNDVQFGNMLLVGFGGVFVEVFKDAILYPVPINKYEAMDMLKQLKAYKLLTGYRGEKPYDVDALVDVIVKISNFAYEHKDEIKEMDLNPIFVYPQGKGVCVVDALLVKYSQ